ncbi:MAG: hypothetical protein RR715_12520 [Comamonas sp.]
MSNIFKRLDKSLDYIIGTDSFIQNKLTSPNLKDIIDNLRIYPVIGFFLVAANILQTNGSATSSFAAIFLYILITVISFFTAAQTVLIFMAISIEWTSALLPPRTAVHIRKNIRELIKNNEIKFKLLFFLLTLPIILMIWIFSIGVLGALTKANLI